VALTIGAFGLVMTRQRVSDTVSHATRLCQLLLLPLMLLQLLRADTDTALRSCWQNAYAY